MAMRTAIRLAEPKDLEPINAIYNHYVPSSDCTMETEPVSLEARRSWFSDHGPDYPVIVAVMDGTVVGWASISKYRPRAAYRPTVEDTIYVDPGYTGLRIGDALLGELIRLA
ncbi:MAG TPA: GNAT family N-acetyltransferase, partial [Methanomassiliicoccales archaeon]|nr:GNAT family N-acetyltransferase [Methanomassiliicoccales archaeon]